jgi:hypothetical protein
MRNVSASMFGILNSKAAEGRNSLFLVTVKIGRGSNISMPQPLVGAYVPVFVAGSNLEAAAKAAVSKLVAQGFEFLDIDGPIRQLDPNEWSVFIDASFPEFKSQFPNQDAVIAGLTEGNVFFGPFAGYER